MNIEIDKAYITLLSTNDYTMAVAVLNYSLQKVQSKYPLIVAVTNAISQENIQFLENQGIIIQHIKTLSYSQGTQHRYKNHPVLNTASKIELFALKCYEKLVYIDADSLVVKNIDDLFERPDGAMVHYPGEQQGFSGLFVFSPRNHYEEYYKILLTYAEAFDGDILGKLWQFAQANSDYRIPEIYFSSNDIHKTLYDPSNKNIKVYHFCGKEKPWKMNLNTFLTPVTKLYKQYLNEILNNNSML